MSNTLLQLVEIASGELGLGVPTYVAGNSASDVQQFMYLASAAGRELAREFDWQALQKEYRFTTQYLTTTGTVTSGSAVVTGIPSTSGLAANTWMVTGTGINQDTYIKSVDSASQVTLTQNCTASGTESITFGQTKYSLPSDYDRQIDRTHYDKSKRWEMGGPESPQQWQFLKSSYISTGPRLRYRIMGQTFQIWPAVNTSEYLGFEYVSNAWASSAAGAAQSSFVADTDTCVFPDLLMIVAVKKKYFEVKGFDSTVFNAEYLRELMRAKGADAGAQTLAMAAKPSSVLVGYENIPDSGYGQ